MKKLVFALVSACLALVFPAHAANNYQTLVTGQSPSHYFKLDGSLADSVNGSITLTTVGTSSGYTNDIFGTTTDAYFIGATTDALQGPSNIVSGVGAVADTGNVATNIGSISFLFKMLNNTNTTGQRYLFSQGTNTLTSNQLGLFMENTNPANGDPCSLKLRTGTSSITIVTNQFLVPSNWYYFAMTYDTSRNNDEVHWYIGPVKGALSPGTNNISNSAIVGDSTESLYIGNRITLNNAWRNATSDPGIIDEFATWNRELTTNEIIAQFSAAGGGSVVQPAPKLAVALGGGNVTISWPTNSDAAFQLEFTAVLPNTNTWTAAGAPTVIGANNVVTTAASAAAQRFYRLRK